MASTQVHGAPVVVPRLAPAKNDQSVAGQGGLLPGSRHLVTSDRLRIMLGLMELTRASARPTRGSPLRPGRGSRVDLA
jgi:hypothetical protein